MELLSKLVTPDSFDHGFGNLNPGQLEAESRALFEQTMNDLNFSARAHDRKLKISRNLSDLEADQKRV